MNKRIVIILLALLLISWIGMVGGWKFYTKRIADLEQHNAQLQAELEKNR